MRKQTRTILLAALAVLAIAGCAARDDRALDEQPGGFYGGISGGRSLSHRSGPDM